MKTQTNARHCMSRSRCDARAADADMRTTDRSIGRSTGPLALAMLLLVIASLVAACGNKGPLVKPDATSRPTPATTPSPGAPERPASTDRS
jgi:predicted small lipoprotein YifL